MSTYTFDTLIIGSGVAGLSAAVKLAEAGKKICLLTREVDPKVSNTLWAQGGIIYPEGDELKHKLLIEDIEKASAKTSNLDAAKLLSDRSGQIIKELLIEKLKTPFENDVELGLKYTQEAAHSTKRIIFKGDYTGRAIQVSLLNYLKDKKRFPNVSILSGHTAIDLITPFHHGISLKQRYEESQVIGVYAFNQKLKSIHKIIAKNTILATGGIGALYLHHSNSNGARGDGHAMAKRAGATLTNLEFIQFHPTTFFDASSHRRFLISEAVRGEGGILLNSKGIRFMEKYHPDLELAPRDIVARSIDEEMLSTRHECVYLDISFMDKEWIKNRFPTIYEHCLNNKIDMSKDPIPVVPAAHYTCGGVKTDLNGKTNLKNLYAIGEVGCTGLHGANRLASTSLAEGLTWGYLAAEDILGLTDEEELYDDNLIKDWKEGHESVDSALIHQDLLTIKQTMWNYVGLTRTNQRLKRAEAMFSELIDEIERFYKNAKLSDDLIGLRNGVEVSQQVLIASRRNKVSVGCFHRKSI